METAIIIDDIAVEVLRKHLDKITWDLLQAHLRRVEISMVEKKEVKDGKQ